MGTLMRIFQFFLGTAVFYAIWAYTIQLLIGIFLKKEEGRK